MGPIGPVIQCELVPVVVVVVIVFIVSCVWKQNPKMGHFGHLVRYLYVGISPRRVNRFSICLLI